MRRLLSVLVMILIYTTFVFARTDIDTAIINASDAIASATQKKTTIAILGFSAKADKLGVYIRDQIINYLLEEPQIIIVTRHDMDKVDEELNYQQSGFVSDSTALSICERLGAQSIIFGRVIELDNKYILEVKMIDVETGSYQLYSSFPFNRSTKSEQLLGRAAVYYKQGIGLNLELNKNAPENIAFGGGITFDYAIFRKLSIQSKNIVSYDFFGRNNRIITLEPILGLRLYLVSPSGEPATGFYCEAGCGTSLIFVNSDFIFSPNYGGEIGYRFSYNHCFIEPNINFGFPYIVKAGLNLGIRF